MLFILSTSSLLLAAVTSAQYTVPAACPVAISAFKRCGGEELRGSTSTPEYEKFNRCFCLDSTYTANTQACFDQIDRSEELGISTARQLESINNLCEDIARTLSGGTSSRSGITPTPSPTGSNDGQQLCKSLDTSISACGAFLPTDLLNPAIAGCFCKNGLPSAAPGCFSFLVTASPTLASNLAIITQGYCEKYGGGGDGTPNANPTSDSSAPSQTEASGPANTTTGSGAAGSSQPLTTILIGSFVVFAILL
ncbi:hypothetical protein TWF730_005238 [Orbilia blumenaviensis]|uniref:Uncharacterized protein n=1 Tax=Orbilia blumenaviensis TaxID=1796055 RepID=A0AAV9VI62_9PEZI